MPLADSRFQFDYCLTLTYYSPYVSGLTNVARDVAEGLAKTGKRVCVVTTQHDARLPTAEVLNGVSIFRAPVWFKLGKGAISPALIFLVRRLSKQSRVLNIHAPMLEAGLIAYFSYAPVVTTYQCDVSLPPTLLGRLQNLVLDWSTRFAIANSRMVTVSSSDYASHSRLSHFLSEKQVVIPPPCHLRKKSKPSFRDGVGPHFGFLGRIVEEKGLDYLIDGFIAITDPSARLLIGGDFGGVAGGSIISRIQSKIKSDNRIKLLGFLPEDQLVDFYSSIDAFVLPSVNSFEAFGIVQVEALMLGIPVIATNIPGARRPVMLTNLGILIEPCSATEMTSALESIGQMQKNSMEGSLIAIQLYSLDAVVEQFRATLELAGQHLEAT